MSTLRGVSHDVVFMCLLLQTLCANLYISPAGASEHAGGQFCFVPDRLDNRGEHLSPGDFVPLESSDRTQIFGSLLQNEGVSADGLLIALEETTANGAAEKVNQKAADGEMPTEDAGDEYEEDTENGQLLTIADPLSGWNRAMFYFNDKFYFWVAKPVTQAYSAVVPEDFRIAFKNFHDNLYSPVRLVNNLLQLKFKAAGNELIRFVMNTVLGAFGLADPAKEAFGIEAQDEDFGQTLAFYGVGHGFYLVWPVLGPSSARDTVGFVGDLLAYPLTYARNEIDTEEVLLIYAHEKINALSFRIGDYEALKKAAIDPYVAVRDAYVQHRAAKVKN